MPNFTDEHFEYRHTLYVDAMYYYIACNNLDIAKDRYEEMDNANKRLESITSYDDYVAHDLGDEIDPDFDPRELAEIEEIEDLLRASYELFVQSIATTHIFCAAALEAYINTKSMDLLNGKLFDQFEKVSLEGKWLMLPKLLTNSGFDPGKQPYQDFAKLIKIRNSLVHHKTKSEKWQYIKGPIYKKKPGMGLESAQRSIAATKSMVIELSKMLNENEPWWVKKRNKNFLVFEKEPNGK